MEKGIKRLCILGGLVMKKGLISIALLLSICLCISICLACAHTEMLQCESVACHNSYRSFRCVADTYVCERYLRPCPYSSDCQIYATEYEHHLICSVCGYGGGAYNKPYKTLIYHTTCGAPSVSVTSFGKVTE